jgi:hypothetical protein
MPVFFTPPLFLYLIYINPYCRQQYQKLRKTTATLKDGGDDTESQPGTPVSKTPAKAKGKSKTPSKAAATTIGSDEDADEAPKTPATKAKRGRKPKTPTADDGDADGKCPFSILGAFCI